MIAANPLKLSRSGVLALEHSHALSEEAHDLWRCALEVRRRFEQLVSLGRAASNALASLETARAEATEENWDGYGGKPVDLAAYDFARKFIRSLPTTAPEPEVGVDPDGEVSVDWNWGSRRVLSVSIGPSGRLVYAALIGPNKIRGTEWFRDEAPDQILDVLSRVIHAE